MAGPAFDKAYSHQHTATPGSQPAPREGQTERRPFPSPKTATTLQPRPKQSVAAVSTEEAAHDDEYQQATAIMHAAFEDPDHRDPYALSLNANRAPTADPYAIDEDPLDTDPDEYDGPSFDFVPPFQDLAAYDWRQEAYEDMLTDEYNPADDPLWHDFSLDAHRWYSEDSDSQIDLPLYVNAVAQDHAPPRPIVTVQIGQRREPALADSGASVSLMSHDVANRLDVTESQRRPTSTRLRFANGNVIPADYLCSVQIAFTDYAITDVLEEFIVADLPANTLIISYPTMRRTGLGSKIFDPPSPPTIAATMAVPVIDLDTDPFTDLVPDHLPGLFDDLPSDAPPEYEFPDLKHLEGTPWHAKYTALCREFKQIFLAALPLEPADLPAMDIDFDEAQLREASLPPRRPVAAPLLQVLREKIDEMLRLEVIVPSTWWFQSPVVIVKQKGKYRFCTDYRHLNRFTRPLKFPIPLNRDTFQMFRGKRILTSLDNRKGYYQLKLAAAAMLWTTFYTPIGSFMYTRIPFGLVSAPAYYIFLMATIVLIGLIGRICVSYFDDTAVFSDNHEKHLEDLRTVFERIQRFKLTLNGEKCQIAVSKV